MKKTLLSLALLAGFSGAAQAQTTRFGVKAGVGLASFTGEPGSGYAKKNFVVPQAGVMADVAFSDRLSFHPELLYAQKGVRTENGASYGQTRLSYLDLPLLLRVHADGLFFEAGPQVSLLLAKKYETNQFGSTLTNTSTYGTRKVDVGYVAGVGYRLPSGVEVGVRYNGGLLNLSDSNTSGNPRNSVFQLQLGYLFGGK